MSEGIKKISATEKLQKLIEQKTNENEALKKLLEELNKDIDSASKRINK